MIIVDYFEIAKQMLITIEETYPTVVITEPEEDVEFIAHMLEHYIEPELIYELSDTNLGLGILSGMLTILYSEYGSPDSENVDLSKGH